jgi:hypothetical protein
MIIEIVSATRLPENSFWKESPLGLSLIHLRFDERLKNHIVFSNQRGLSEIYNSRISSPESSDILIFIHDDVWIDDFFLADHVIQGLKEFDIIGVAGNKRIALHQPSWIFIDDQFTWDKDNLSGAVAHGPLPFGRVTYYGKVPAACELLDGVFLAAVKSTLQANMTYFDHTFDFHFYDLDFCRTARSKGLRLGTWHISITHTSGGSFGSPAWAAKRDAYRKKWEESSDGHQ